MAAHEVTPAAAAVGQDAAALWRLSDQAKNEAMKLRNRARQLDREAERLSSVAAAVADGRPIEEALSL